MKIVASRYDAGIVATLSIWYDERRRRKKGRPSGDLSAVFMSMIPKKPRFAQRGPDEAAERPQQGWDTS